MDGVSQGTANLSYSCRIQWYLFKKLCKTAMKVHLLILNLFIALCMTLSSPESKAQVSLYDQILSVVRHFCCCCRKLFTFSSSSPEPLGWFQPNLVQSIFGWRDTILFKWRARPFPRGDIFEIAKILGQNS